MKQLLHSIFLCLACSTLAGCINFGLGGKAKPNPSRFYVLGASATTPSRNQFIQPQFIFGMRSIALPEYLNSPKIQILEANNKMSSSEFVRWSEPIADGIERIFNRELTLALPEDMVLREPWGEEDTIHFSLSTRIDDLLILRSNEVILKASTEYRLGTNGKVAGRKTFAERASFDPAVDTSMVQAIESLLSRYAKEMANDMLQLEKIYGATVRPNTDNTVRLQMGNNPMVKSSISQPAMGNALTPRQAAKQQLLPSLYTKLPQQMPQPAAQEQVNYGNEDYGVANATTYPAATNERPIINETTNDVINHYGPQTTNYPANQPVQTPHEQPGTMPIQQPMPLKQPHATEIPAVQQPIVNGTNYIPSTKQENTTISLLATGSVYVTVENLDSFKRVFSKRLERNEEISLIVNSPIRIVASDKESLLVRDKTGKILSMRDQQEPFLILE